MHSDLLIHLAKATARERSAASRPPHDLDPPAPLGWAASPIIALRLARADDARALAELAALDEQSGAGGRCRASRVNEETALLMGSANASPLRGTGKKFRASPLLSRTPQV